MSLRKTLEEEALKLYDKTGETVCIELVIWVHQPGISEPSKGTKPKISYKASMVGNDVVIKEVKTFGELLKFIKNYGRDEILFREFHLEEN